MDACLGKSIKKVKYHTEVSSKNVFELPGLHSRVIYKYSKNLNTRVNLEADIPFRLPYTQTVCAPDDETYRYLHHHAYA